MFLALVVMFLAGSAQAFCIKCDQSTGYACFIRLDGTKANCDSPSDAGCVTWGACSRTRGGGDGGPCNGFFPDCDPFQWMRATPMSNDLEVAVVSVTMPFPARAYPSRT
jgi:hypothetical protein